MENNPAGGIVGPDEWVGTFLGPAFYEETWVVWGQVFSDYVNDGNTQELVDLYDAVDAPGDDNEYAAAESTQCTDSVWPANWNRWTTDSWETFQAAPFATWDNTWGNAPVSRGLSRAVRCSRSTGIASRAPC